MRNSTFLKIKTLVLFYGVLLLGISNSALAQLTVSTVPPLNGGNGSQGCTFEVSANTSVLITGVGGSFNGAQPAQVWYRPGGVSASPGSMPNIATANGWVNAVSNVSITGGGAGVVTPIPGTYNILIPAGQSYGFYVGGTSAVYTTGTTGNPLIATDGNLTITCSQVTGWGGGIPNPVNNPRHFNGSITYIPVTGANSIGIVGLESPVDACPGIQNVAVSVRNFGTNQVNTFNVDWEIGGVAQPTVNATILLDTLNGANPTIGVVVLGPITLVNNQTYNIKAWTSNPNGAIDTTNFDDTIDVNYTATIPIPTALNAINVTPTSADFTWIGGAGGQFEVEYGPLGFALGTGTNVLTTNNPLSLTTLTQNTQYDFYVRAICGPGDTSAFAGPHFFKTPCVPSVTAFPYFTNFDGATTDWISSGTNTTWALGTPANAVINSAASAPNSWVTNLTGVYNANENGWVEGPCMAFDTLISPEVSVDVWYNSEFSWDGMQLQYSSDAGANWNKVSSFGDPNSVNWYTDNSVNGLQSAINDGDGWTGRNVSGNGSGGWVTATADLSSLSGLPSVKFRLIFGSDGSVQDEGVAFDNFRIIETALPFNVKLVDIQNPETGCGLSATENVILEYANIGLNPITTGTTLNFSYYINGVATNENLVLSADLLPGDTSIYTFTAPANLSVPATYTFGAKATYAPDQNPLDDSLGFTLVSIPIISNYPYSEDFDSGNGGWISGGSNNSWQLGTPAGGTINSPASAPNSWVTNLTGPNNFNEASYVQGPCFAFDSMITPEVSISVNWNSNFTWDGVQLQHSLNGGQTWSRTGAFGSPNSSNWYNDNGISGLQIAFGDPEGWSGTGATGSNGWIVATEDLSPLAGQSDVIFRMAFGSDFLNGLDGFAFDNFQIVETALPLNLELTDVLSPKSGCGLSATDTVTIEYANVGLTPIVTGTTLNFTYYLNGVATSENLVLAADMLPGDTAIYSFTATANLATPATYAFGTVATFVGDQNPLNDSLGYAIVSIPVITSFPYYQDFESGNGGWTAGGTNSTWALGTPAGPVINSASSGTNAWMTNLTGNYNNGEESFVLGPCFDFTNLVLPIIKVDVNWNSENSWDGMKVEASTDAGATWNQVGAFGDPFNWYNDNSVNGLAWTGIQEGWTGTAANGSNGWLNAKNDLGAFAGNSGVLMRVSFGSDGSVNGFDGAAFDNFHILESPNNDIAVDSLIGLQSGCGYTDSTIIRMRVTNLGIVPQTNVPVFYTVNGVASPVENIPATINPGATLIYQFTNAADLSVPQLYTVIGHSALSTDEDTTNDSSPTKFFQALFTPKVLSVTDGETCESGPVTLSMTSNGDTDRWFTSAFGGTAVGTGSTFTIPNVTKDTTLYVQTTMNATGCNSASAQGRIAVHAEHSTTPIINYTTAVAGTLTIQFTTSLSSNVDSIRWDFGDGTSSNIANTFHAFPSSKSYLVTLTAYSGSCIADTAKSIFVPVGGINDNPLANLTVYPNPSEGAFRISADGIKGEVIVEVVTITGNVVYSERVQALNDQLNHDIFLNNVSSGTYILKIRNDQTIINGRILID